MSMSRKEIQPYMAKGPQKLITTNQILAIHQLLANLYGGVTDLRSPEMVKMLDELANEINACRNRAEIIKAATNIIYMIVRNAPFIVANKRTAFLVASTILHMHGLSIEAVPEDILVALTAISTGNFSREETGEWLRGYLVAEEITAL